MLEFMKILKKECTGTCKKKKETKEKIPDLYPAREIVNGILYDTSKATKIIRIYNWSNNHRTCIKKDLYKTKNQRFFTVSDYGEIQIQSEYEVRCILSKYPDKYQEIFGEVEEA